MKMIIKKIKYIIPIVAILTFSCTDELTDLNKDPNAFNTAEPANLLGHAMKQTLDLVGGNMNFQMFVHYSHFIGGVGGQHPRFGYTESTINGYWETFNVDILKNVQEIIDTHQDDPDYANRVHIAKIWKSYVYSVMVSTFGPVPILNAFTDETEVAYDSEEVVYTEILNMLKDAGENMDPEGDRLISDPLYNGNITKWIKFANTLRLKIGLRISVGFPSLAEKHVKEAVSDESMIISSNNEQAALNWGMDEENWSYNYNRFVFAGTSLQYPKMNNTLMLYMKTYKDPRVDAYADPSPEPYTFIDELDDTEGSGVKILVEYSIPHLGVKLASNSSLDEWDLNGADSPLTGMDDENYSNVDLDNFMAADMEYPIITYSETNFMMAEVALKGWGGSSTSEDYYYAGIEASFAKYGVSGAGAYKDRDGVKWGTASIGNRDFHGIISSGISTDPMEKIVVQRWLSSFIQGHDVWCLQKRTRLLDWDPHFGPDSSGSYSEGVEYVEIPERMIYAPSESGLNGTAVSNAISSFLGNDDRMSSPLKMNKTYTKKAWENIIAEYNYEFASQYYGDSVDDLIAAGIEYEIVN